MNAHQMNEQQMNEHQMNEQQHPNLVSEIKGNH